MISYKTHVYVKTFLFWKMQSLNGGKEYMKIIIEKIWSFKCHTFGKNSIISRYGKVWLFIEILKTELK